MSDYKNWLAEDYREINDVKADNARLVAGISTYDTWVKSEFARLNAEIDQLKAEHVTWQRLKRATLMELAAVKSVLQEALNG